MIYSDHKTEEFLQVYACRTDQAGLFEDYSKSTCWKEQHKADDILFCFWV